MKNVTKIADTILTQMPGGLEDRGQKKPIKIINEILKEQNEFSEEKSLDKNKNYEC